MDRYLKLGTVSAPHGLRGEFKVSLCCDGPRFAMQFLTLYLGEGYKPCKVSGRKVSGQQMIFKLEGIDSIEAAQELRGEWLYFSRSDAKLPEGVYFESDLIGMKVVDADSGQSYGNLTKIYRTGANDVYELTDSHLRTKLLPAIRDVIVSVSVKEGEMQIRPLRGLFDGDAGDEV